MYGVYEFKRGFGGHVYRVIPTQDLPLRPALYWPYALAVTARRNLQRWRRQRFARQRARARARREATARPAMPVAPPTPAPTPTNA
jgi:hypothetical protein